MAEATRPRRGGEESPDQQADDGRAQSGVDEQEPREADETSVEDETRGEDRESGKSTLTSELRDTIREAAIEVLRPVARKATTSAAKYAVTKGPDLVKDRVAPKIADAGGAGAIAKGVASKGGGVASSVGGVASSVGGVASSVGGAASGITGKLGGKGKKGKSPTGTGRGRRLPVQVYVDVAADLETTYDQFTQFEDWPQFMHRVEKIEQRDDATLMWHENIWGVRRSWEAEITEQTPCERIAWRSKEGPQTVGVASFHRLSDNLTRVYVNLDFQPQGLFEKAASGMRISRRALKSDLMRFKAFVEMRDEATGAWRGRIEEGEVVDEGDEQESESPEDDRDEMRSGERGEDSDEDQADEEDEQDQEEPRASEDQDYEDEDDAEEDDEPRARGASAGDEDEADEDDSSDEPEGEADDEYAEEDEEAQPEEDEEEQPEEEPEPEPEPAAKRPARRRTTSAARPTRSRS